MVQVAGNCMLGKEQELDKVEVVGIHDIIPHLLLP
jgi:hypothetical protein